MSVLHLVSSRTGFGLAQTMAMAGDSVMLLDDALLLGLPECTVQWPEQEVAVYVNLVDLSLRGMASRPLHGNVQAITDEQFVGLVENHELIQSW